MAIPAAAEKIAQLGPIPVTNSLLTGWVLVAIFVSLAVALAGKRAAVPRGIQNAAEAMIDAMLGFMDQVTRDRARSRRFLPFVGTLFPLILVSNWLGLLPGVGTIGVWGLVHGEMELIPLIRPATSDLNMTLALGITAVVASHIIGIMTLGFFKHWGKFIQIAGVWKALRSFGSKPLGEAAIGLFTALIDVGVGLLELVSEAAKMLSLSLRLFGNIFAGEVLLHVLSSIFAYLLPTPFMFMELIVGVVQALVFSILTLVYLTLATEPPHGEHEDEHHEKAPAGAH
jgi:F-type H+-transporting ATPase subunit a